MSEGEPSYGPVRYDREGRGRLCPVYIYYHFFKHLLLIIYYIQYYVLIVVALYWHKLTIYRKQVHA